tara:strand:+ start:3209 stop:3628 length:420 start_codon:yes stop_codon:yes gene_type:complete
MKYFLSLTLLLTLGFAQSKITIDNEEIDINQNEAFVEVLGMVCSMCAFGIEEGFSNEEFVDKSKFSNGVLVDIDAKFVQLGLKKSSSVNPESIYNVIQDAGYEVKKLYILKDNQLTKYSVDKLNILEKELQENISENIL